VSAELGLFDVVDRNFRKADRAVSRAIYREESPKPHSQQDTARKERARQRRMLQDRLKPHVVELAIRREQYGLTASEMKFQAKHCWGLLTGEEGKVNQRALSWLGKWLAEFLVWNKHTRPSIDPVSHGKPQHVMVHPDFAV
jgi:hypothetical protein